MRQCGDEVVDPIHDGCPVACVGDAPLGDVTAFKSHVNVGFFHGAARTHPAQRLELLSMEPSALQGGAA